MIADNFILELIIIFAGAVIFSTLFLYLRQPIILAYIALGIVIGPLGFGVIANDAHIEELSHLGIILLLFLIGLSLEPKRLLHLFGKTSLLTLGTSLAFMLISMGVVLGFGFSLTDSLIVGAAMMFSSTIVGLKLIPTTTLHHAHTGEMMISVLLFQDILAIVLILFMVGGEQEQMLVTTLMLLLKLTAFTVVAFVLMKTIVTRLFVKYDTIREYTFLLSLGWGLIGAGAAKYLGLSYEIGAFVAGVSFASIPVAIVIAEELKPLRDFFLILFFFSIGARFDIMLSQNIIYAAIALAVVIIIAKPVLFRLGFKLIGESERFSTELGARLGQASEFSLLVAYTAFSSGIISASASSLIQTVVILTFVVSTYWVVYNYPTPIASRRRQRRD
ncbi:MAG: cation:proton antiporter [Gammaproteobacteria bacterium]